MYFISNLKVSSVLSLRNSNFKVERRLTAVMSSVFPTWIPVSLHFIHFVSQVCFSVLECSGMQHYFRKDMHGSEWKETNN